MILLHRSAVPSGRTKIWHFTHVMQNCTLESAATSAKRGDLARVVIGNNVKIRTMFGLHGLILEDDVFCGPSMV